MDAPREARACLDTHLAAPQAPSSNRTTPGRPTATRPSASPLARIAAVVLIVAAIAVVAWLLFRGGTDYTVTATFDNAGQLVKGNQVEVGGRPIGTISDIELTDNGRARVTMKLNEFT